MRFHIHVLTESQNFRHIQLCHSSLAERMIRRGKQGLKKRERRRRRERERDETNQRSPKKRQLKKGMKERERSLSGPLPPRNKQVLEGRQSLSFLRIGSQALDRTASCGSLRPALVDVLCFLISRLSRTRRFCWRVAFFLSVKVVMISGSSQLMMPVVQ